MMNKHKSKVPNFFIVGAPKCGTSALYTYLKKHPEVFLPEVKEPHYFGSDIEAPHFIRNKEKYLSLFNSVSSEKRVGEASVWYLFSEKGAEEISEYLPEAKIIIMLRNPVDMIYSYHSQRLAWGNEDITDFKMALDAECERKQGKRLPQHNPHPIMGLYYREIAKYSKQVKRVLDRFDKENVHIIIFEDFVNDVEKAFKETLLFLDISTHVAKMNYEHVNPNRKRRSRSLNRLLLWPPEPIIRIGKAIVPRVVRKPLWTMLFKINTQYTKRKDMEEGLRESLKKYYQDDVAKLSELLGRDLVKKWLLDDHEISYKQGKEVIGF